ncbi:type I-E CRISPR-associated protein Cse1/CasA [Streptomyces sp. NPDC004609]|uniref:type I-E CRISPR-associated protein Cse1/CasA n=1 Tax=Streptomyces sp. NPDC004609 TaxID=3364704 RepID=UPI003688C675
MPALASLPGHDRFCLVTRPWIPVRALDGESSVVGLRELFREAHRLEGVAVALPPAASGLLRILCAMAARITGLDRVPAHADGDPDAGCGDADEDAAVVWSERRYALLGNPDRGFDPEEAEKYLTAYAHRLRLHCPDRPFLQDPRLADQSPSRSGVNKLVMARPAGNNQVFFGHFNDSEQVALPSAEAALHLVTQLYYGPSGQCTPRVVAGRRFGNTRSGPLRRTMSYHPVGRSLYETLLLGIPAPAAWPQESGGLPDRCPWERDELPDPLGLPHGPVGPLSALTERYQHAVLLRPGPDGESVVDATITWAFRENRPDFADPYLIWDETKDGKPYPRNAEAERSLWRDLDALILKQRGGAKRRPAVLDGLSGGEIPDAVLRSLRVFAYGFDQDGQTRDRVYFSGSTPPLFALLEESDDADDNELALGVRHAKQSAEQAAWRLETALRHAWREYSTPFGGDKPGGKEHRGGAGPWAGSAVTAYWPAAEGLFWDAFHAQDFTDAMPAFARLALDVYDEVTRSVASSPRGAKAREGARGLVAALLRAPAGRH